MLFITDESELNINEGKVSLYFYASWIPFNKKMITMINKMQEKFTDIKYFAIDVDFFKNLCKRFNVTSIPEIIIFNDGKEVKRINGLILTSALKNAFSDI